MKDKLFNKSKNKIVIAKDFVGNEYRRNLTNFRFRASAYGVLIENKKILLKRHPSISKLDLPGGGIEMDETIPKGLMREFQEETGLIVKPDELICVEDSLFTSGEEDAHGILIFYTVKQVGGKLENKRHETDEIGFYDLDVLNKNNIHSSCWNIIERMKNYVGLLRQ